METKKRIELLDALRGLSLIMMIFYHLGYDLWENELFTDNKAVGFFLNIAFSDRIWFIVLLFQLIFIVLAGISSNFSRNNFKRGLKVLVAAVLVTIATVIVNVPIWFGILHFMAAAMLLYALLSKTAKPVIERPPAFFWFSLFIASYIILDNINPINPIIINIFGRSFELPLFMFGFYSPEFGSADYFPVFPWVFAFLAGAKLGEPIKNGKLPKWFYDFKMPFLPFVGRHTLLIYLLHQPILYLLILILAKMIVK